MRLETDLIKYLPYWYREILDYQQLCLTESQQFEGLAFAINNTGDNFFFQTADEGAIALWEKVLHILPNPQTETLEFRRTRVISRLSTKPPFTLGFLYNKLDELIGPGLWKVEVDYLSYTLYIETSAQDQSYYNELMFTIGKIKPAHIVYINRPTVTGGIKLSGGIQTRSAGFNYKLGRWRLGEHAFQEDIAPNSYNYLLGVWELGKGPFGFEQGWKVVNTAVQIKAALKSQTAAFIAEDVKKARLNGSVIVSPVSSQSSEDTVTVTYAVPEGIANAITQVELLDEKNNVLTSSNVYVPIITTIELKHIISVKEGES